MTIQMIPLNQLAPSRANVRKTGASVGIEELAASIEAHGLLQNLQVRPAAKDKFEVVAGGRRLAAMTILRRQKKLAKDFPVPCHVLDDQDAQEISLAENTVRRAMHPADQFIAFQGLVEQGKGVEEIAARFGASVAVVRQRLKLASVSPVLIGIYRDDQMSLDQLMAFAISDDHRAQEAAWYERPEHHRRPEDIRAALTAAQVEADDRRVRFIGLDAYLAAGGGLNRDLFQPEHEGYLTDPGLLDRLVAEKLDALAATVRTEGWTWIEIMPRRDYAALSGYGRVRPIPQPLDETASARKQELMAEYDALVAEHGEEPEPEIADQLDALWREIEIIDESALAWRTEDLAVAGAVISLDYDGEAVTERGLVRPVDVRRLRSVDDGDADQAEATPKTPGLSVALIDALTAERTAAMRAVMIDQQAVGLAALCQALVLPLFYGYGDADSSCVQVKLTSRDLRRSAATIEDSPAGVKLAGAQAVWRERLPSEGDDLFGWLLSQDREVILDLLTFCAAQGIDAVCSKADRPSAPRLLHADALAEALSLDMGDWWSPTKERYLARVPKALVLEAVSEGLSPQAADNLAGLKRDRLIEAAEQRLAGIGWLPPLLRSTLPTEAEFEAEAMAAA